MPPGIGGASALPLLTVRQQKLLATKAALTGLDSLIQAALATDEATDFRHVQALVQQALQGSIRGGGSAGGGSVSGGWEDTPAGRAARQFLEDQEQRMAEYEDQREKEAKDSENYDLGQGPQRSENRYLDALEKKRRAENRMYWIRAIAALVSVPMAAAALVALEQAITAALLSLGLSSAVAALVAAIIVAAVVIALIIMCAALVELGWWLDEQGVLQAIADWFSGAVDSVGAFFTNLGNWVIDLCDGGKLTGPFLPSERPGGPGTMSTGLCFQEAMTGLIVMRQLTETYAVYEYSSEMADLSSMLSLNTGATRDMVTQALQDMFQP